MILNYEKKKEKNIISTTKKHDGDVDGLNGANGDWRRWRHDNNKRETEEEEVVL